MKKNTLLYILLVFLIAVNGFFIVNYIGRPDSVKRPKEPMEFLFKQLNFNEAQLAKVETLDEEHHKQLNILNDQIRTLKDNLFDNLHYDFVDTTKVDSITNQIGNYEKELDKVVFYHFRSILELCNDKQKEKFKTIINEAIHKGRPKNSDLDDSQRPPSRPGPPPSMEEHRPRPPRN